MAISSKTTVLAAIVAALAVALVAGVEVATPHTAKYDSRVRITGYIDNQSFLGRVGSERKACKRKRLVTVWKRNPGAMDGPVGTARSNRKGIWAISAPSAPSGRYYATVKRRVIGGAGHRHVCKRDRSKRFRL
ncbi:MAG TPA: hypothetical protein VK919_00965 [Solirubrobacterales bacterium]|nr:hypothetical protein [Solirubrobacterales bacterium]